MTYTYVTVSGSFPTLTGTVTFTPSAEVTDVTGTVTVLGAGSFTSKVSGGSFTSAPLLATDNPGLLPAAWAWEIAVALTGARAYTYPVIIPASMGTAQTLASLPVSVTGMSMLSLDSTAADIQPSPGTASAGNQGLGADSKHVHPQPPVLAPTGLTGATAASRYAGATTSGSPATGTFAAGDYVVDETGGFWVCTAAGTPGTWRSVPASSQQFASDSGYLAWTGDIFTGSTTFSAANVGIAQTSGAICLTRLDIPQPVTANGFLSFQWRQPTGGSPASSYVGLYNSSGTQLFVSSDLTSTSSNLLRLNTGVTSFTAGPLYVASLIGTQGSTAGGLGFFIGGLQFGAPGAVSQIGTIPYRCTSLAGTATSLPPSLTLSSFNSRTYYYVWAAID